eukprot:2782446-Alexandrium_andersonii.AAC.1
MPSRLRRGLQLNSGYSRGHHEGYCGASAQGYTSPPVALDLEAYIAGDPPWVAGDLRTSVSMGVRRAA